MKHITGFTVLVLLLEISFCLSKPVQIKKDVFSKEVSESHFLRRLKRAGEEDMKNFHWSFSVESPSLQVDLPSSRALQTQRKEPEVSVQFFDGIKAFGTPGESVSRQQHEASLREQYQRAKGWDGSRSVFLASRECCGPNYPFRTCCQM